MQTFVSREVIALTVRNSLTPEESSLHLKINRLLRDVYARSNEGRRKARAWQGEATGDLVPFETRFCPATGWAGMSNTEWDRMVRRALR